MLVSLAIYFFKDSIPLLRDIGKQQYAELYGKLCEYKDRSYYCTAYVTKYELAQEELKIDLLIFNTDEQDFLEISQNYSTKQVPNEVIYAQNDLPIRVELIIDQDIVKIEKINEDYSALCSLLLDSSNAFNKSVFLDLFIAKNIEHCTKDEITLFEKAIKDTPSSDSTMTLEQYSQNNYFACKSRFLAQEESCKTNHPTLNIDLSDTQYSESYKLPQLSISDKDTDENALGNAISLISDAAYLCQESQDNNCLLGENLFSDNIEDISSEEEYFSKQLWTLGVSAMDLFNLTAKPKYLLIAKDIQHRLEEHSDERHLSLSLEYIINDSYWMEDVSNIIFLTETWR